MRRLSGAVYWSLLLIHLSHIWATHKPQCTHEFSSTEAKTGNFSSPKGTDGTYPNYADCYYRFHGRPHETIQLYFHTFDLEEPAKAGCKNDFIDICTTDFHHINQIYGRYCGQLGGRFAPPNVVVSMHPELEIRFKTDYVRTLSGFHASYEFVDESTLPEPQPQNGCGGMLTGVGGVIESPGFPNKYENDTNCEWLIRVHYTKHIFIKILELQLEGGLECNKAELAVIDGYVNRGNIDEHKKAYCGDLQYYSTDAEKTIESERNRVLIKFQTSPSALGNKGFRVVWTEVSKNAECPLFYCEGGETCIGKDGKICSVRTRYCIDPSLVCDGVPNCGEADVSDEASCYFPLMIGICVAGSLLMLALIIAIVIWRRKSPKRSLLEDPNIQLRQLDHSPNMMRTSRMNRSNLSLPSPIPSGYDIRELAMHHSPRRGSIRMHRSSRSSPAEETFLHRGEKEKQGAECHFNFMNTFKPIPSPTQV